MQPLPRWALLSSGSAPVLLVGGWAVAGALQRSGYDPLTQTISALAGYGAAYRWIMTGVMFAVGACYAATAAGLRGVAAPGRIALACGGAASVLVALSPEPAAGPTLRHTAAAVVGVVALAVWPLLASERGPAARWVLRPWLAAAVTGLCLLSALWFLVSLRGDGPAGVAERLVTGLEALWPFVVVAACVRGRR
ncbi:DUF998 domain-containing protein [Streptacidiphilus cavernicola]|uniref:DUF998 domain-containing protein n=1 Tax=Streptacidiphilus cavernicola TaxID=3342716 RepID=A0ABV6W4A3_9ACTN